MRTFFFVGESQRTRGGVSRICVWKTMTVFLFNYKQNLVVGLHEVEYRFVACGSVEKWQYVGTDAMFSQYIRVG